MFEVDVSGDDLIARALSKVAERLGDWREAWPEVNRRFERLESELFASSGSTGAHGRWQDVLNRPDRRGAQHLPLIRTGALRDSLTRRGADAVYETSPTEFTRGSSLRYARFQMQRRGNIPARRPVDPTDEQIHRDLAAPLKDEARKMAQSEGFAVTDER